jgi:hypothetical protein
LEPYQNGVNQPHQPTKMDAGQIFLAGRVRRILYSHSQLTEVIRYIQNQEAHHSKKSFREEYLNLLNKFDVPYDERYVFKEV